MFHDVFGWHTFYWSSRHMHVTLILVRQMNVGSQFWVGINMVSNEEKGIRINGCLEEVSGGISITKNPGIGVTVETLAAAVSHSLWSDRDSGENPQVLEQALGWVIQPCCCLDRQLQGSFVLGPTRDQQVFSWLSLRSSQPSTGYSSGIKPLPPQPQSGSGGWLVSWELDQGHNPQAASLIAVRFWPFSSWTYKRGVDEVEIKY